MKVAVFKTWWLYLWAITATVILTSLWFLPFHWWAVLTFVTFGTMEGIGIYVSGPYPPLTDVIRKFLPAWVTFPAIYALVTWAGTRWFHWPHSLGVGLLAGLLGWFQQHFDGKYDS